MEGDLLNAQPVAEVDLSRTKISVLGCVGILLAVGLSYTLSQFFLNPSPVALGYVSVLAGLFLVVIFLEALLIKEFSRLASFLFLNTLGLALMFLLAPSVALFIGSFLAFAFFQWGSANARGEMGNGLKLRMTRIARLVMPKAVTALSLFIVAAYIGAIQHSTAFVSKDLFTQLVLPTDSVVRYFYPGVTFTETAGEALNQIGTEAVHRNPEVEKLSPADQERLAAEYAAAFKTRIAGEYLKVDVRDEEPVIDLLYRAFSSYVANIPDTGAAPYASAIFALILFLVIRSIGTPFYYIVTVFAVLVYQVLRATGFLVLALETRTKEILVLK
jgi:hypothetical protein